MNNFFSFIIITLFTCQTALFSQGNRRNPGLSDRQLLELLNDTTRRTTRIGLSNLAYVPPPAGAKYIEVRSVDPAAPPAIIDIVGNLNNKKTFKLSDIASSVKYIQLQPPPGIKFTSSIIRDVLTDDEHIFVNTWEGLFCYTAEGQYLYPLTINETDSGRYGISIQSGVANNFGAFTNNIDLSNGNLIFCTHHKTAADDRINEFWMNVIDVKELDTQMRFNFQSGELKANFAQPISQRRISPANIRRGFMMMDDQSLFSINSLTGTMTSIDITGDTLCKFNDYDRPESSRVVNFPSLYRINGKVMLRKSYNDTIFRVEPPNRFVPAYVMQWGAFKPDVIQHASGADLEGKLVFSKWTETSRYIFIEYTEGRNYPIRLRQGKVGFHWAIYDKVAKTLTHILASTTPAMIGDSVFPPLIENDIDPVGMPFWPEGVNHKDNMYMTFSKEQISRYITTGKFRNDKLQAIHNNMPDGGFCIMVVK